MEFKRQFALSPKAAVTGIEADSGQWTVDSVHAWSMLCSGAQLSWWYRQAATHPRRLQSVHAHDWIDATTAKKIFDCSFILVLTGLAMSGFSVLMIAE